MIGVTIETTMKIALRRGLRYMIKAYSTPKAIEAIRKRSPAQASAT